MFDREDFVCVCVCAYVCTPLQTLFLNFLNNVPLNYNYPWHKPRNTQALTNILNCERWKEALWVTDCAVKDNIWRRGMEDEESEWCRGGWRWWRSRGSECVRFSIKMSNRCNCAPLFSAALIEKCPTPHSPQLSPHLGRVSHHLHHQDPQISNQEILTVWLEITDL